jgi:hypothetical protein
VTVQEDNPQLIPQDTMTKKASGYYEQIKDKTDTDKIIAYYNLVHKSIYKFMSTVRNGQGQTVEYLKEKGVFCHCCRKRRKRI